MKMFRKLFGDGKGEAQTAVRPDTEARKSITLVSHIEGLPHAQIGSLAFSPDERRLAIASSNVQIFDTVTSNRVATLETDKRPMSLAFRSYGNHLLVGLSSGAVEIWLTDTWQKESTIQASSFALNCLEIDCHGTRFAIPAGYEVQIWDCIARSIVQTFGSHGPGPYEKFYPSQGVRSILFDVSGDILTSIGSDGTMLRWNTTTGERVASLASPQGRPFVSACETTRGLIAIADSLILPIAMNDSPLANRLENKRVRKTVSSTYGDTFVLSIDTPNQNQTILEVWDANILARIASVSISSAKLGPILIALSGSGKYLAYSDVDSVWILEILR